jgi:RNA polymerase sigma-70 factor (ECF subfamily)
LLERHRGELMRYLELRLDPRLRGRMDVSDITQDTFVDAFRGLSVYVQRRPMPFRLWLRRLAYQRLLIAYRRHVLAGGRSVMREIPVPERSSAALVRHLLAREPSPSGAVGQQELIRLVRQALGTLSDVDREVILLRTFENMSYEEVGQMLAISAEAARKRHGRALLQLAQLLRSSGLS